jgi:uncharacterized protein
MFTVELHNTLIPVDGATWKRLFPEHPDPPQLIELMDTCRMPSLALGSVLVRLDGRAVLLLPVFSTRYDLTTTLTGKFLALAKRIKGWFPDLMYPVVVGVGFIEGEWGEVGVDAALTLPELNQAWQLALRGLETIARKARAQLVWFKDFTQTSGRSLPIHKLSNYTYISSLPFCQMTLPFKTLEEYLNSVDSDMRRYLKRISKRRQEIDILRTRDPEPWLDEIYRLYEEQVEQSEISFGIHPKSFFSRVCQKVSGAEYVLYFAQAKLIGFELLVVNNGSLVQKYIGIDRALGRAYKLYFLSWLEDLETCIERGISHTHVGATQEALKSRLGAHVIPSAVLVRHLNPFLNKVLTLLQSKLSYESKVDVSLPALGSLWRESEQTADLLPAGVNNLQGLALTPK